MTVLDRSFYFQDDVVSIAKQLIGKELVHFTEDGAVLSGLITETEAYRAPEDKASHAFNMRRTERTETMYLEGGKAYIYLCYGLHHLFNVVTHQAGIPHAVLVRGIIPLKGIERQLRNRNAKQFKTGLMCGPGKVSKALEIERKYDATDLIEGCIQIHEGVCLKSSQILRGPRIGIDYAAEWKDVPWRFWIQENDLRRYLTD